MTDRECQIVTDASRIVRAMAHKWARRKGLGSEVAEQLIDLSLPSVVRLAFHGLPDDVEGEELSIALAIASHGNAKRIRAQEWQAEQEALACWACGLSSGLYQTAQNGEVEVCPDPDSDSVRFARQLALILLASRPIDND